MKIKHSEDFFESGCELVDVTSVNRPDTSWRFIDANGHEHRWHANGHPAESYKPDHVYEVPSIIWIIDETRVDEDGESYEVGHSECRECGAHVKPGSTADTTTQYIPGLRWYRINGEPVSEDEFTRRATKGRT